MPIAKLISIALLWIFAAAAAAAAAGGSISGVVVDDKGAPISDAVVLYHSLPNGITSSDGRRISTGTFVSSGARTVADGSFAISGLPPAVYYLCAYGTKDDHLGTCEWGQGTTSVPLADGQTAQVRFVVAEGTLLTFQVEDPKHQVVDLESLPTVNGGMALTGANFSIGIWAGTRYARAKLLSVNGATRRYQLAIPKTAAIRLHLDTSLHVADSNGGALALRQPSSTLAAGGQSEVIINLAIP
jgi:hypothetical protein